MCFCFRQESTFPSILESLIAASVLTHALVRPSVPERCKGFVAFVAVFELEAGLHGSTDSCEVDFVFFFHKPKVCLRLMMSRAL